MIILQDEFSHLLLKTDGLGTVMPTSLLTMLSGLRFVL